MHIKLESIMLSALILIIMGFACHFKAYLSEKFTDTLDPNKLYSRLPSGEVQGASNNSPDASTKFSRMYRMEMGSSNYDSKFCKNTLADPCPEILKSHSEVPADLVKQCSDQVNTLNAIPSPSPTASSLHNFTDDEVQEMVRKYAFMTSQRNPQSPWVFNPYGSPAIDM